MSDCFPLETLNQRGEIAATKSKWVRIPNGTVPGTEEIRIETKEGGVEKLWLTTLDSVTAVFAATLDKNEQRVRSRSRDKGNRKWFGSRSFAEAREWSTTGWAEGAKKAARLIRELDRVGTINVVGEAYREEWDVTGSWVDVGAYLSGEPECMADEVRVAVSDTPDLITIYIDMVCSADVTADQLTRRAVTIAALVDALESRGVRCELWGMEHSPNGRKGATHSVLQWPIKRSDEPMSLERLSFAAGSPAMYRRGVFGLIECLPPRLVRHYGRGYGYVCPAPPSVREYIGAQYYLPPIKMCDKAWGSTEGMIRWILDVCKGMGFDIEGGQ